MSLLTRSGRQALATLFEAMEDRVFLNNIGPSITAFTFASGATLVSSGDSVNRTAADGLTFNLTVTPNVPANKVTKVQIFADLDDSGSISAGDVLLGNAKKADAANSFSLTLKGKKARIIPALVLGRLVNFLAVATAKDKTTASDASKSLTVYGNLAPVTENASVVITGPTKTSGIAAHSKVNFKFKGFSDPDGKIAGYSILWDADDSGTLTNKDFNFGSTTKPSATETMPTTNGRGGGDAMAFPTSGTVRFLIIPFDNDLQSVIVVSSAVAVKTGPTVSSTVTNTPDLAKKKNSFTVTSIAKGTANGSAALKSVTFYSDVNNSGSVDAGDKVVGKVKLTPTSTNASVTVKNSKVAGKRVLAVVEDAIGFTSGVAFTAAVVATI